MLELTRTMSSVPEFRKVHEMAVGGAAARDLALHARQLETDRPFALHQDSIAHALDGVAAAIEVDAGIGPGEGLDEMLSTIDQRFMRGFVNPIREHYRAMKQSESTS